MKSFVCAAAAAVVCFAAAGPASAQPKYEYGTKEEVKEVEYKASAQAGFILTRGNSETVTLSGGAKASRKDGANRLALEVNGAFARSTLLIANDADGNGELGLDEISEVEETTTQAWLVRGRYDRFFAGDKNSAYVLASIGADEPAGKELLAGGQVGYSRQLYKNDRHELVGEAGYDFTREQLINEDGNSIHSARLFAGYTGKLTDDTGLEGSIEALLNLNDVNTSVQEAGFLEDSKVVGRTALKTKLYDNISFQAAFTLKYDAAPAPLNFDVPFADGVSLQADSIDTITEMAIIVNFL